MKAARSLLTDEQKRVLKLRNEGYTQKEIARMFGTSRANVSTIEKRARLNLEKARVALKEYSIITAPLKLKIEKGLDVLEIPKIIFKEADSGGIKIKLNSLELIARINAERADNIKNRVVIKGFMIYIGSEGQVTFA